MADYLLLLNYLIPQLIISALVFILACLITLAVDDVASIVRYYRGRR